MFHLQLAATNSTAQATPDANKTAYRAWEKSRDNRKQDTPQSLPRFWPALRAAAFIFAIRCESVTISFTAPVKDAA
jgi:hypothetical protein